ncbi:hypothetical protein DRQ09_05620 [candidate division KSB1 bacterium]|nr:MAG: hypothetical protein DRQ09_05620 [candidate division KSB1 bacterium]
MIENIEMEERKSKKIKNSEVDELKKAYEFFNQTKEFFLRTSEKLIQARKRLEKKVSELNLELEEKNRELSKSLKEMDSIRNHLKNILESMNMGVIAVDLNGKVTVFNRAASEITGYTVDEVLGKSYFKSFGKGVDKNETAIYTLKKGIKKVNREKEIISKNGTTIPVEYSTSVVSTVEGEVIGAVEIFSDLREIKRLKEEIQQARTLAALGEMAANVAHEIRNPLGGIGGFAALLERDIDVGDPRRNLVQKIIEGVASLNRIASNLLIFTRPVRPKKRKEDIRVVIDEVLALLKVELEQENKDIDVVSRFPDRKINIFFDPELIQQVLLNILKNAIQAIEEKGVLEVELFNRKDDEYVDIIIKDSGIGMDEDTLKRAFNPFFTTKSDGTGLGLAIAKKIVESHQGKISIYSKENKGTKFVISLPY